MDLIKLNALDALDMMKNGELSAEEYVRAFLDHIKIREPLIGAWAFLDPELAIQQARHADKRWRDGNPGQLNGIPIGIKDIIDTKDMPTEYGPSIYKDSRTSEDAHVVKLLKDAGAVIMGKCVASGSGLAVHGKTKNPKDLECTPGGTSSGSAAAVSDHMVPLAIGSQVAGSTLKPASFTGILGFKPTFGTISRYGMSPVSQILDHVGIFANSIGDIDLVSSFLFSFDENDLDMNKNYNYNQEYVLTKAPKFAFVKGPVWGFGEDDMKAQIVKFIKDSSFEVEELNLNDGFRRAAGSHAIIASAVRETSKQYIDAIEQAKKMRQILKSIFTKFDAIITPAATGQAPRDLMNTGNAIFNGYWTMMGVPAISLPVLKGKDGLPIGIQVITSWNEDSKLLKIAEFILQETKKSSQVLF